jgi:hypothetical protein
MQPLNHEASEVRGEGGRHSSSHTTKRLRPMMRPENQRQGASEISSWSPSFQRQEVSTGIEGDNGRLSKPNYR